MEKSVNNLSRILRDETLPQLSAVYLIDEQHNNKYTRLFHSHENELELYYVYSGFGYYMVNNQPYAICKGDMVICNAKVLHGDAPTFKNSLKSYCCALTNVKIKGLPDNWLIDIDDYPIIPCGTLADKVGSIMELIYMLSLDFDNLYEVSTSMANSILLLIYQLLLSRDRHVKRTPSSKTDAVVEKIKTFLDSHYEANLTLESISETLNMNPSFVSHSFKAKTGISPIQYMLFRRFGEAQSLLMNTELSMAEISDLLGFSTPAHFSSMFRKHVGISPIQYKKSFVDMNKK
ncbi:AraC-like DNA-binding protein [Aequitasia blattaphilus]|uniref:AraC family transcriptional regulator n=1 Tax=Aequitasia blattaphilus TaxID=2949332 RepID=A0ABT1ECJ7_9FIRM|nr:AraC family transcriptional regulator [Aequitasia blattaphilus]MCP1103579.1 AraC family transcriptional regulator [Aequitasia blattaphilus]MCR8616219.1 AraC family transcriptional regulator [Aequitasia blattaphilus]